MAETKSQRLVGALDAFLSTSPDVEAAAVVSFDGLTMASALPDEMDEDRVGAMAAALLSLGEQAAQGLGRGELQQLFVEADNGFVFLMSARNQAVLVAVVGRHAKIGLMLYEMRRAAGEVGALLEGTGSPPQEESVWSSEPTAPESTTPGPAPDTTTTPEAAAELVSAPQAAAELASAPALLGSEPASPAEAQPDDSGLRDPFGDRDLDDPHYLAANGRGRDGSDDRF